ncbi:sensor histidine kinase [Lutibacter flavus]|uniref:histidine kinase n=1 Tax=Lutibacter flavus TaxID=691689 RepID=A0A238YKS9_9FLAO|nr:sensor histidine kinase [Lutibacter flavus]SNR71602.1 Histidine kinase-, DNA gyrase B-, and HSP90-like ATPase [Lutibacter flavus]
MKKSLLVFSFFLTFILSAQEIEKSVRELKIKIEQTENSERLIWLDSLTKVTRYSTDFKYDSIATETINYALYLDSLNMAASHTADLIYYKNNIIIKPEEGLQIFKNFMAKGVNLKNKRALALLYLNCADSYYFLNDFESALENYEVSKKYAKKADDIRLLGLVNLYMGYTHSDIGDFPKASIELQDAEKLFQQIKDTFNIIGAKNSLAILYSQNAFYEVAEQEREEAIVLAKKNNRYRNLVSLYANQAEDFRRVGKGKEYIANLLMALESHEKSKNDFYMRPILICKLIVANAEEGSLEEIEKYKKEIESDISLYTNNANKENYIEAMKNIAFVEGDYKKALLLGKEHLALKIEEKKPEGIQYAEKFLSKVYKALGNKGEANLHLNNYYVIKDSISSVQKINALSYYQTYFETKKRDFKIENQEKDITILGEISKVKTQIMLFGGAGLISIFGFILLFKSRNTAKRRQKLQESFSRNLITAQENERTRVARELHDSVGQKLMLLTKKTKMVENSDLSTLSENTLEELRAISRGLHPPTIEGLGITKAIISMINEVDEHTNIFFTNDIENIDNLLNKDCSLHVYRIIQEVLNNIVKHANAKATFVTVEKKKKYIKLSIKDNGNGFDFSKELNNNLSLGMKTLRERAKIIKATLKIYSEHNKGTVIQLKIPI